MQETNKGTTKCDKKILKYDVETAQYEYGTIKYEKQIMETTKCENRIVTCDV